MKIKKSNLPNDSMMSKYLPANYSDTYSCEVISEKEISPDDLIIAFWTKPPKWIQSLFNLRNKIAKLIGLNSEDPNKSQSQKELAECIRSGGKYNIFSIEEKSEKETILKLSDKHLDAYISAYVERKSDNMYDISISTVVYIHNWLGYIYFYPICPFHKIVVKGMMKHVIKTEYNH